MSDIAFNTPIFISAQSQGKRFWLENTFNERHASGKLVLQGKWSTDPAAAKPQPYETALIARRRMFEECNQPVDFSLQAGDLSFVEPHVVSSPGGADDRVPMSYKGLIAVPGFNTKSNGEKCWFVRLYENGQQTDSLRGESAAAVIDAVIEKRLAAKAEKAPAAPAPQQVAPAPRSTARLRPGSFRG